MNMAQPSYYFCVGVADDPDDSSVLGMNLEESCSVGIAACVDGGGTLGCSALEFEAMGPA